MARKKDGPSGKQSGRSTAAASREGKKHSHHGKGQRSPGEAEAGNGYLQDNREHFLSFQAQLAGLGLALKDIPGDGNCLFRALADQLEGNSGNHMKYRAETVRYLRQNRADFEPFVEDDISFDRHVDNLVMSGTYAGQDCLVAFARLRKVNIVIHQLNSPLWQIPGAVGADVQEVHLSYHNGEHYSSVRRLGDTLSASPANLRIRHFMKPQGSSGSEMLGQVSASNHPNISAKKASAAAQICVSGPDGTASATRDVNDIVLEIMQNTNCQDAEVVEEALAHHMYNTELTTDYIVNYLLLTQSPLQPGKELNKNVAEDPNCEKDSADGFKRAEKRPPPCSKSETDEESCLALTVHLDSPSDNPSPNKTQSPEQPAYHPAPDTLLAQKDPTKGQPNQEQPGRRPIHSNKKLTKQHMSNKQRKELHRREKGARQEERRRKQREFEQLDSQSESGTGVDGGSENCVNLVHAIGYLSL